MHRRGCGQGGFTLVELVVTVAIVSVLAWMVVPLLEVSAQRQREAELRLALRQIRGALDAYHQAVLDKKIESPADGSGYPPDLETLVKGVRDITSPEGAKLYFLRRLPRDPMNPDTSLAPAETWGLRSYDSPHDAPQPGADVYDVYSLAEGVSLNGIPYREF